MELLSLSVGVGLVVSLIFSELFGLAAGGMVVPGYVALYLHRPLDVAVTVGAGIATWGLVQGLESLLIVYGRRRTVLMILVGYLVGMAGRGLVASAFGDAELVDGPASVIGYIIPGLIAIWLSRQGLIETLAVLVTASVVVRLVLVAATGGEAFP
jgi:poly-gamma-glutamate biosynthesis protein PgsC/CapC